MAVNSSPARRVFIKDKDGNWLDRALPFLERFRTAAFGEQRGVIKELAALTGQAENTARRMLVALQYLHDKGVSLTTMYARPPVMAIEAVLRVGKRQAGLEDDLLAKLLRGQGTAAEIRAEADRLLADLAERQKPITARTELLTDVILGSLIPDPHHEPKLWVPNDPLPRPSAVVDVGAFRLSVFAVTGREPFLAKAFGYRLLEASVLKAVVTSSRTVVCSEIPLNDLKKIREEMTVEPGRLEIDHCILLDNLRLDLNCPAACPPGGDLSDAFEDADASEPYDRDDDPNAMALLHFQLDYENMVRALTGDD